MRTFAFLVGALFASAAYSQSVPPDTSLSFLNTLIEVQIITMQTTRKTVSNCIDGQKDKRQSMRCLQDAYRTADEYLNDDYKQVIERLPLKERGRLQRLRTRMGTV